MRIMFLILKFLYWADAKNEVVALTLKQVTELLAKKDYAYSERTIYNKLQVLLKNGYIKNGMKDGKASTFYITKEGIEWMGEKEKDVDEEEKDNAEEQNQ